MKAAFSTSGSDLSAPVDARFGRCARFILCDVETGDFEVIENRQNLGAAQGAGIQAAQAVVRAGADCVVTGHCGPKAFKVLKAAGVAVYSTTASSVAAALDLLRNGELTPADSADVEGHWA